MVKTWHFYIFFGALLGPNGLIFSTFLNCSEYDIGDGGPLKDDFKIRIMI